MKKIIWFVFALMLIATMVSCNKSTGVAVAPYQPAAVEAPEIEMFIEENYLQMTMSPDSIWYNISNYGDTLNGRLTPDSLTAVITFTCKLLDGTIVDQTPPGSTSILYFGSGATPLNIYAYTQAIPYFLGYGPQYLTVGRGGTFSFISPSMYQNGSSPWSLSNGNIIPPNSPLYYTVSFVGKQPS